MSASRRIPPSVAFGIIGGLALLIVLWPTGYDATVASQAGAMPASCSSTACEVRAPTRGTDVVLAVTKEALNEMARAGSDRAIAVMVVNGSAFLVPQGTAVSVVDRGFGARKVLVLEGRATGRSGWLPAEWVVDKR